MGAGSTVGTLWSDKSVSSAAVSSAVSIPAVVAPRSIDMRAGAVHIGFTEAADDIEAAQRLRYQVFAEHDGYSDLIGDASTGRDADRFDEYCTHLLVRHEDHGVIGCARLLLPPAAIAAGGWYSATEFDLAQLDPLLPSTIEMGRACVAAEHRDGSVTALMWAAVLRYLETTGHSHLMGCVSVPLTDQAPRGSTLRGVRDVVRERHGAPHRVFPHVPPQVDGVALDDIDPPARSVVPPLLRGYIRLGARVCGDPAIDDIFDVGDLLTLLNPADTDIRYLSRLRAAADRLSTEA